MASLEWNNRRTSGTESRCHPTAATASFQRSSCFATRLERSSYPRSASAAFGYTSINRSIDRSNSSELWPTNGRRNEWRKRAYYTFRLDWFRRRCCCCVCCCCCCWVICCCARESFAMTEIIREPTQWSTNTGKYSASDWCWCWCWCFRRPPATPPLAPPPPAPPPLPKTGDFVFGLWYHLEVRVSVVGCFFLSTFDPPSFLQPLPFLLFLSSSLSIWPSCRVSVKVGRTGYVSREPNIQYNNILRFRWPTLRWSTFTHSLHFECFADEMKTMKTIAKTDNKQKSKINQRFSLLWTKQYQISHIRRN